MIKTKKARLTQVKNINELEHLGLEPNGFIRAALDCGANILVLTDIDAPKKGGKLNEEYA
ncbi:MAG: hypothetical protein IJ520_05035 [Synergistaceae bacterium]|nr:hypothetical protein [Synergistaceae bacterium]MBR1601846.1 hypothetical protein [Synergistaceae bacterium]MBR1601854.1 hypothetical protein [Synergistaceae bacterium]